MKNKIFIWSSIFLLGMIYGVCIGFTASGLPVIGRQMGWSLEAIGLLALPFLPMGVIFLWAPMLDKYSLGGGDRYRRWIVLGLCGMLGGLLLASQSENSFGGLLLALLLLSAAVATLMLSFNALLIERLTDDQLPRGKSLQMGGYFLGEAAGGGLLLMFYPYLGWETAFFLVIVLVCTGFLLLRLLPRMSATSMPPREAQLGRFFQHDTAWRRLGWVLVLCLSCSIGNNMLRPFMIDYGFSVTEVGVIMGSLASVAGGLGAMAVGRLLSVWSVHRVMTCILLLIALDGSVLGGVVAIGVPHFGLAAALTITGNVLFSAFFVTLSVQTMRWAGGNQPGTDFSLFECMAFISGIIGSGVAGVLADALGFSVFFMLWAALVLLALLVSMPLYLRILVADAAR
ncbi:hypothetical protein DOV67_20470 [Salmonella enterica subsp. enterica serovar Java]|uniref:MFS transporter n=3 Tax=Salmonella enterica TaxID=28901 RepID=A0A403K4T3_SALER|nr:hypothetical protein [Salmonella enterica subsp. enterica serovar Java]EAO1480265.1 MFS transporter [Salmonella enterica]EBZ6267837.1 MFS transporter [Salmonella enterica subsp. enterica serovar Oranienburg]EBR8573906.1 hypothetical protein [Salmonella enterica subsp. enterica serovar Java]ECA1474285.1 MFS transporter [Salmonella enterica subsp. enterica serovar Oranienburg]